MGHKKNLFSENEKEIYVAIWAIFNDKLNGWINFMQLFTFNYMDIQLHGCVVN